jgi:glycine cleavage system H protein
VATIGISNFAVEQLSDVVFLSLPKVGQQVTAGDQFGEVESVKAVSPLYAPISGEVIAINQTLPRRLEVLNTDPFGEGWMIRVRPSNREDLNKLLDRAAYESQCAEGH